MESNPILDARQAVQLAKQKAAEMLNEQPYNLEEIERDDYKGHDVWDITLSFLPNASPMSTLGLSQMRVGKTCTTKGFSSMREMVN